MLRDDPNESSAVYLLTSDDKTEENRGYINFGVKFLSRSSFFSSSSAHCLVFGFGCD